MARKKPVKSANLQRIRRAEEIQGHDKLVQARVEYKVFAPEELFERLTSGEIELAHEDSVFQKDAVKIERKDEPGLWSELGVERMAQCDNTVIQLVPSYEKIFSGLHVKSF